jgi:hypothetical protein
MTEARASGALRSLWKLHDAMARQIFLVIIFSPARLGAFCDPVIQVHNVGPKLGHLSHWKLYICSSCISCHEVSPD